MRAAWVVPLLLALLLPPGEGHANRPAARAKAVALVEWRGRWSPEEREPIEAALAAGIDAAGLELVSTQASARPGRFDVDPRFSGCIGTDACRFEYGRTAGATYLFVVTVVRQGKSVRVAMNLYEAPLLAQHFLGGAAPLKGRPAAAVRRLVGELLEQERRMARGTLELSSAPAGDAVFIDGHAVGLTNLTRTLLAGPHLVRIERRGATPHIARVMVVASKLIHYEARFEKQVVPAE